MSGRSPSHEPRGPSPRRRLRPCSHLHHVLRAGDEALPHKEAGEDVDDGRDREQNDRQLDQGVDLHAGRVGEGAVERLRHERRYAVDGVVEALRDDVDGRLGDHRHRHRLSEGPPKPEHDRPHDRGLGVREHDLPRDLPLCHPQRLPGKTLAGIDAAHAGAIAVAAAAALARDAKPDSMRVLGPAPAPIERIKGRYRFQVMLKAIELKHLRDALA
ncbi:MAG: hypothetical protein JRM90_07645, partial [Nitrososphaerota archaeon]|nr:hypothetical protein [Nitrososphaerota archaeon]